MPSRQGAAIPPHPAWQVRTSPDGALLPLRFTIQAAVTRARVDGKLAIDKMLLKMPVLGDVLRKSAVSRFTRTLGTLIGRASCRERVCLVV